MYPDLKLSTFLRWGNGVGLGSTAGPCSSHPMWAGTCGAHTTSTAAAEDDSTLADLSGLDMGLIR